MRAIAIVFAALWNHAIGQRQYKPRDCRRNTLRFILMKHCEQSAK